MRLGVWCGLDDPFLGAVRELVDRTDPEVADTGPHPQGAGPAKGASETPGHVLKDPFETLDVPKDPFRTSPTSR